MHVYTNEAMHAWREKYYNNKEEMDKTKQGNEGTREGEVKVNRCEEMKLTLALALASACRWRRLLLLPLVGRQGNAKPLELVCSM